jgi:hypothetical protein
MPFMPMNAKYVINGRVMGGTMRRKVAKRTKPWLLPASAAAENSALLPPEDEEEDLPPAKRSRLQAPDSTSTTVDGITTEHTAERVTTEDSPTDDDIPTDPVTPADSLLSKVTSRAPRRTWNGKEDTKLIDAVEKHGNNWLAVAMLVPGRTGTQCRQRLMCTLESTKGKTAGRWKSEEDAKLIDAVSKYGKEWVAVAKLVHGRTNQQCRKRWSHTLDPGITRGRWKPEEDAKLIKAVEKHGKNWVAVATLLPGRTDDLCRYRWVYKVDHANGK